MPPSCHTLATLLVPLLAQTADGTDQVLPVTLVVTLVSAIVTAAITAVLAHAKGKRDGVAAAQEIAVTPQPLEVRESQPMVSRRECMVVVEGFDSRLGSLERRFDAHLSEVRHEMAALNERIVANQNEVLRAIGRLEGGR